MKELIKHIETGALDGRITGNEVQIILRALRLLAAAEANDGSAPETDHALISASGGAFRDAAGGIIDAVTYEEDLIDRLTNTSRRLERERNAALRALEEAREDVDIVADTHYILGMKAGWNCAQSEDEAAFFARVSARQDEISAARGTK